jgi:AhpD family alkylhydroperoxidase
VAGTAHGIRRKGINMDWEAFMDGIIADIELLNPEIPDTVKGFYAMGAAAKKPGALDEKTKEIMALGIAIATRCDSCIGFHIKSLVRLGLTRPELCEALAMATYMGGGPSYAFSAKALKAYDTFKRSA